MEENAPQNDGVASVQVSLMPMSFRVGGESVDVKSYIDDSEKPLKILWEDTDLVKVYDDIAPSQPNDFTVVPSDPATGADLQGQVSEGSSQFYAVYPSEAAVGFSEGIVTVTVPSSQVIPAGRNVDPKALVSVAYASRGEALQFRNVCGFLAVEVSYSNIKSVTITGTGIAGNAAVDGKTGVLSDGGSASATGTITLTHEAGLFPKGTYYVALLPGTTQADGFTVSMTQDIAGFSATRTASGAIEIARNGGFTFGKLDTSLSWTYLIGSADELVAWNNRYADWKAKDKVYLTADIDMSGKDWTPHNFSGTFDGQGHKIYNIVVERSDNTPSSFIWALTGVLKNVIIGSYDGVSKDGTSHFYQLRSDNSDYRFAGLVNNTSGAASLSNVKNFADVKVLSSSTAIRLYRVAGICAQWSSTGNVIDCENYGDITAESEVPAKENNGTIAGIISFVNTDTTVSGCKNYGTVTSNNSQVAFLSGIVGNANGGSALQVSSCMNYGKILSTATPTGFNAINLGGIVAQFSKTGSIVKDSDNHGEILHEISSQTSNTNNLGGIVAYMIYGTF